MSGLRDNLDPDRLIDHANRLLGSGNLDARGRPFEMDLRRAVSASYYAVFHAVSLETVRKIFGPSDAAAKHGVRWINHGDVRRASTFVSDFAARPQVRPSWAPERIAVWELLAATPLDPRVVDISAQFIDLMDLRHVADYDRAQRINKPQARQAVADATGAVSDLRELVRTAAPGISEYLGLVAFAARRLPS